jgi:hypothetical protein
MLDDIVFKSQKKSPGHRHFISTPPLACSLARSLQSRKSRARTRPLSKKFINKNNKKEEDYY